MKGKAIITRKYQTIAKKEITLKTITLNLVEMTNEMSAIHKVKMMQKKIIGPCFQPVKQDSEKEKRIPPRILGKDKHRNKVSP